MLLLTSTGVRRSLMLLPALLLALAPAPARAASGDSPLGSLRARRSVLARASDPTLRSRLLSILATPGEGPVEMRRLRLDHLDEDAYGSLVPHGGLVELARARRGIVDRDLVLVVAGPARGLDLLETLLSPAVKRSESIAGLVLEFSFTTGPLPPGVDPPPGWDPGFGMQRWERGLVFEYGAAEASAEVPGAVADPVARVRRWLEASPHPGDIDGYLADLVVRIRVPGEVRPMVVTRIPGVHRY